jgi:hypothetical protein
MARIAKDKMDPLNEHIPYAQPAPPTPPPPGPLTTLNYRELATAKNALRKIRRAQSVAKFDGWSLAIFGLLTAALGFDSAWALIGGLVLIVIGGIEIWGANRLGQLDPRCAIVLTLNQLVLGVLLVGYFSWQIYAASNGQGLLSDVGRVDPEAAAQLKQFGSMANQMAIGIYSILLAAGVAYSGAMALYFFTRGRHVRNYLLETPDWIVQMQRSGVSI